MVGARAWLLESNDARWLAAELQDGFGNVDAVYDAQDRVVA